MCMGTTHATTGAATWLVGCAALSATGQPVGMRELVIGAAVTAFGALVPDIDCRTSLITRSLPPVTVPLHWTVVALSRRAWRRSATKLDRKGVGPDAGAHRYLTHTAAWTLGVTALAIIATVPFGWWWAGAAFGVGNAVHIAGDWPTESGVPWKWPMLIGGRRWQRTGPPRWLRFRVSGRYERLIVAPAWGVLAALAVLSIMMGVPTWR